jgi:hypothetical protein
MNFYLILFFYLFIFFVSYVFLFHLLIFLSVHSVSIYVSINYFVPSPSSSILSTITPKPQSSVSTLDSSHTLSSPHAAYSNSISLSPTSVFFCDTPPLSQILVGTLSLFAPPSSPEAAPLAPEFGITLNGVSKYGHCY